MACSCITSEGYNFHADAYKDGIVYQDVSNWVLDKPYQVPHSYVLDITLPEKRKPVRTEVQLSGRILPKDLGTQKIPDGIYIFELIDCGPKEYSGCCGIIYTKYKLLYPNLKCCLDDAYARLDFDDVDKVHTFFRQAEQQTEFGKIKEAQKLFKKGKTALKNLNCNCPCL
jgi:hypothetical protein